MFDFIIGGAQKAATTWLYLSLRDHSEVDVPSKKMEWEYVGSDWQEQRGLAALNQQFGFIKGIKGHVSVQYLADARCAKVLSKVAPGCKLIFVLREPMDRLASAYSWYWRKAEMEKGLNDAVQVGLDEPDSGDGVDRSRCRDLIERGFYGRQLSRYLEFFPQEQILLLSFDEVCENRNAVWGRVQNFIGCSEFEEVLHARASAKQNSGVRWLVNLERKFPRSRPMAHLANLLHQGFCKAGYRGVKASLSLENKEILQGMYRDDLKVLLSDPLQNVVGADELRSVVEGWLRAYRV